MKLSRLSVPCLPAKRTNWSIPSAQSRGCKKILFLLLLQLTVISTIGQSTKHLNFIIVIDENIVVSGITDLVLEAQYSDSKNIIPASYIPGDLLLDDSSFSDLSADNTKEILLKFYYSEFKKSKQIVYSYAIKLSKEQLNESFFIVRIYNLTKKKYGEKYLPAQDGLKYVYEFDSPSYSTRLIIKSKY